MTFKYEIVAKGGIPTWNKESVHDFQNPVHVGEFIKTGETGSKLLEITSVEHYPNVSVLYFVEAGSIKLARSIRWKNL